MVVCDLPKVETRVRFPLLAPHLNTKPAFQSGFCVEYRNAINFSIVSEERSLSRFLLFQLLP